MTNQAARDYRFAFAAWTAGRASSRGLKGFTVKEAAGLLKASGLHALAQGIDKLPEPEAFDKYHAQSCEIMIATFQNGKTLTYGRAAKLANVFTKTLFLSGFGTDGRLDPIHPPIDRVLLTNLSRQNVGGFSKKWQAFCKHGWTNFDRQHYNELMELVKIVTEGRLWAIEKHWQVHS